MKLAEALLKRADTQKRIKQLAERLKDNATHQEGVPPAEDPKLLMQELTSAIAELQWLISHINSTNMACVVEGRTLTDMLAERDVRLMEVNALRSFLEEASDIQDRYSRKEIRTLSSVDVPAMRKTVDEKAEALRKLDIKIQALNWTTDLV